MNSKSAAQENLAPLAAAEECSARDVVDQATANRIARVNAISISAEDLSLAAAGIQQLPLASCNPEARTRCLGGIFSGQNDKMLAINSRLEAMARLVRSGKIPRYWVQSGMVRESVFLAAAKQPLLVAQNELVFEPESFVAFLLDNAEVEGHA